MTNKRGFIEHVKQTNRGIAAGEDFLCDEYGIEPHQWWFVEQVGNWQLWYDIAHGFKALFNVATERYTIVSDRSYPQLDGCCTNECGIIE